MSCVPSVDYKVARISSPKEESGKVILSPYLFVLCMEKLSHIISNSVLKKDWRAIRAAKSGPLISHLFFADDLIFFGEASIKQAETMKQFLDI